MKTFTPFFILFLSITSCAKNIDYSQEFMDQTSGSYLFNQEDVIGVFYENNDLYITWKSGKIKPVVLDETTFFVPDMYSKLRFVTEPETQKIYLGIVSEINDSKVKYAYPKMADNYKTPRMLWGDKDYKAATAGFLKLQEADATQMVIDENEVNKVGYRLLGDKDYENAILVFKMNVALYPNNDNVYGSSGEAYLKQGDSLQAFDNFKKALELNSGNQRAKEFVEIYKK